VRDGELDVEGLFARTDVTSEIEPLRAEVSAEVKRQICVMSRAKPPEIAVGRQCAACALYKECWSFLPERHVFTLYRAGKKGYELMDQDILAIKDIPEDFPLTEKQSIQVDCVKTARPHVEAQRIRAFLKQLKYPLYFLDFETFMMAVPPYDDLSPYEQVPFQYSLHVIQSPGTKAEHYSFLSDGITDPRPAILGELKKQLGRTGSIVAYNAPFETRVLESCTYHFPQHATWLKSTLPRFVDLFVPFREFYYYHPDQNGSASIKAVLPAMTGRGYAGLEIGDGELASLKFRDMAFGNLSEVDKQKIREALETYCHQDTEGMIEIVKALQRVRG